MNSDSIPGPCCRPGAFLLAGLPGRWPGRCTGSCAAPARSRAQRVDCSPTNAVARGLAGRLGLLLAVLALLAYGEIETCTQGFVVLGLVLFAAAWMLPIALAGCWRYLLAAGAAAAIAGALDGQSMAGRNCPRFAAR